MVEQSELTWLRSEDVARSSARSALERQCELIDRLHGAGGGAAIYVPDANALLYNVDLERWAFADCDRFELVLGPSILVELDELKINHRNPDVRTKAEGLISRIKRYRARGQLTPGRPAPEAHEHDQGDRYGAAVGRVGCLAEPREPRRPLHRDGHEVIRRHPRSTVTIVSRDINLQSKAELASLPRRKARPNADATN